MATKSPARGAERHVHRVKLSDFRAKKEAEGAIDLELDDGAVIRVPPPELWGDDVMELMQADRNLDAARAIIGDDAYDSFVAGGGNALMLMSIISDELDLNVGESPASPRS